MMDENKELNVQVAEALGWKWAWMGDFSRSSWVYRELVPPDWKVSTTLPIVSESDPWKVGEDRTTHVAPYGDDISAAWPLVDRLITDGWDCEIALDDKGAEVWFNPDRCPGESVRANAPTVPEAIRRAFLKAMSTP